MPLGSGAIESTIRRVLNLRLKGTSLFWEEGNAEAVLQLRAAVLSGRWEERLERTREAMAKDRRTDWDWDPPECLAELKALERGTKNRRNHQGRNTLSVLPPDRWDQTIELLKGALEWVRNPVAVEELIYLERQRMRHSDFPGAVPNVGPSWQGCSAFHRWWTLGSTVDAAHRTGYPCPDKLGPQLVEKCRDFRSSRSQKTLQERSVSVHLEHLCLVCCAITYCAT